jgi:BolA protein
MSSPRIQQITHQLEQQLSPTQLEVIDDSALHVGHAGAKDGAGHYTIRISSPSFKGLNRVSQHRLVYDALSALIPKEIHALAIIILN